MSRFLTLLVVVSIGTYHASTEDEFREFQAWIKQQKADVNAAIRAHSELQTRKDDASLVPSKEVESYSIDNEFLVRIIDVHVEGRSNDGKVYRDFQRIR